MVPYSRCRTTANDRNYRMGNPAHLLILQIRHHAQHYDAEGNQGRQRAGYHGDAGDARGPSRQGNSGCGAVVPPGNVSVAMFSPGESSASRAAGISIVNVFSLRAGRSTLKADAPRAAAFLQPAWRPASHAARAIPAPPAPASPRDRPPSPPVSAPARSDEQNPAASLCLMMRQH